jgi:hypothetical protein
MTEKHKHYNEIVAWASGSQIQEKDWEGNWVDIPHPTFRIHSEYRIKPEKTPDVVRSYKVYMSYGSLYADSVTTYPNLTLTFDGDTGLLKSAEVLNG